MKKSRIVKIVCLFAIVVFILSSCGSSSTSSSDSPAIGVGKFFNGAEEQQGGETTAEDNRIPAASNGITICVDPGHGFEDTGTESEFLGSLYESDINLLVAKELAKELKVLGYGVVMTHDGTSIPKTAVDDGNNRFNPDERVSYANALGSSIDYFISIHCDVYTDNPDIRGTRVYYYELTGANGETGYTEGYYSAEAIKNRIAQDFPNDPIPTVGFGNYAVIRETAVPASLVEIGFVSNSEDAANMLDEKWRSALASSIAYGLDDYFSSDSGN